jgi:hypothetical protein
VRGGGAASSRGSGGCTAVGKRGGSCRPLGGVRPGSATSSSTSSRSRSIST